jgi:prepilin-type N-terminal cleavage/methylation domain-containing protein
MNRKQGPCRSRGFTLVEVLIVVAILGILLAIAVPAFTNARNGARAKGCQYNLKQIYSAKERWAMDKNKSPDDVPVQADLTPYYTHNVPICPAGGEYTLGRLQDIPICSIGGVRGEFDAHVLP